MGHKSTAARGLQSREVDDFDAEAATSLIPMAWLECLGDASDRAGDEPRVLGYVPHRLGASADQLHDRISECTDASWLLILALNHPDWAEPAMRQLAEVCKATPCWASWLQHCQDAHDEARMAAEVEGVAA